LARLSLDKLPWRRKHLVLPAVINHLAFDLATVISSIPIAQTSFTQVFRPDTMVGLTSAAGLVGFLAEPDPALQSFALHTLNEHIDLLWPEVSASLGQM
jgi:hypothetical protein